MKPRRMALLALTLSAAFLYAQKPGEPNTEPEPETPVGPIVVRLVAKKKTYALDRGGLSAEAYTKAIAEGTVPPPSVDLVLELVNVSKESHRVRVTPIPTFDLQGKGVTQRRANPIRESVTLKAIKPGEKYEIPLSSLAGQTTQVFWTEPGKYTLAVSVSAILLDQPPANAVAPVAKVKGKGKGAIPFGPAGKGGKGGVKGMARGTFVTLTSKSIELTVVAR